MCLVWFAAQAMKMNGSGISSCPHEWCSPIQASSKPSVSMCLITSRSRSYAAVGSCPTGKWNGAMNVPNFSGMSAPLPVGAAPGHGPAVSTTQTT